MSVDTHYEQEDLARRTSALRETGAFRPKSLLYAMCASVACTLVAGAVDGSPRGVLITAVLGPVISMVFTTHGPPRIRTAGIVLVTVAAATVAVTGLGASEVVLRGGKSLFGNEPGIFARPPAVTDQTTTSPTVGVRTPAPEGLLIQVDKAPECDEAAIGGSAVTCTPLEVRSESDQPLEITGVDGTADFSATAQCSTLGRGDGCTIQVTFHPVEGAESERHATLVVHHSLPGDPTGVEVSGTATGTTGPQPSVTDSPIPTTPTVPPETPDPVVS